MKIAKKIFDKAKDKHANKTPTIVFLGDSVTQGCFELPGFTIGYNYLDADAVYHNVLKRMIYDICPETVVNIINAGIGGDNTNGAVKRLQRDVLNFNPDMCVVCFGLNDVNMLEEGIETYKNNLKEIFGKLKQCGSEIIFLTPNMLNSTLLDTFPEGELKEYSKVTCKYQNEGLMDKYMDAAREAAKQYDVPVCDCYAKWKQFSNAGLDTTTLLANAINHPMKHMHKLFAYSLFDMMFFN